MSVDKTDVKKKVARATKNSKRCTRKGGKLRKAGQHWYELEAYFDIKAREIIGVNESGYMRGVLEDFVVVQVPEEKSVEEINVLGARLADMGIKALVVKEGITFLRLREVSGEQEKTLNKMMERQDNIDEQSEEIDRLMVEREKRDGTDSTPDKQPIDVDDSNS